MRILEYSILKIIEPEKVHLKFEILKKWGIMLSPVGMGSSENLVN